MVVSVSRGARAAEDEQGRCTGNETAIGAQHMQAEAMRYAPCLEARVSVRISIRDGSAGTLGQERQGRKGLQSCGSICLAQAGYRSACTFTLPQPSSRASKTRWLCVIWYLENLLRHRSEREALDALVSSADWLVPGEWRNEQLAEADLGLSNSNRRSHIPRFAVLPQSFSPFAAAGTATGRTRTLVVSSIRSRRRALP